jgi:hypothetical protein
MYRPLMNKGIGQLEQMFRESADDPKLLRRLIDELECRSTNRALALLTEVQSAVNAVGSTDALNPVGQLPLLPDAHQERSQPQQPQATRTASSPELPDLLVSLKSASAAQPICAAPDESAPTSLALEAAYRALKVSGSASWQAIELARREIVQKASPEALESASDSLRSTLLARATEANDACARIWFERCQRIS